VQVRVLGMLQEMEIAENRVNLEVLVEYSPPGSEPTKELGFVLIGWSNT
jgi:hypothetical protein